MRHQDNDLTEKEEQRLLMIDFTIPFSGGFPTAGINAKGQGTIDPTGYVAYGPAAASGAIEAGIDPKTGAGAKASGAFHLNLGQDLGQVGGKASISLWIDSKGLEFGGLVSQTLECIQ